MSKRIIENGSVSPCPCITCFGRQYVVAARTPCTVAVYKSARLPPIPSPSPRDWVDMIACCEAIQPLGLLAWAATGKDVGLTPNFILDMAARTTYSQKELDLVIRYEQPLNAAEIARKWHAFIWEAREVVKMLPPDQVGKVVLTREGGLFKGSLDELANAIRRDELVFHEGELGGVWPTVVEKF